MKTSNILIFINIISLILAVLWWYSSREYEPIITCLGLLGALIVQVFVRENSKRQNNIKMTQKSGKNSTNIQIGGNLNK